jgi:hypothetical protein
MFDFYDNEEKDYELTRWDGTTEVLTEQELHDFILFCLNPSAQSFEKILSDLNKGMTVTESYYDFDWNMGTSVYKGNVKFKKISLSQSIPPKIPSTGKCKHEGKYVNSAGGFKFWVCPTCKKDLGDA